MSVNASGITIHTDHTAIDGVIYSRAELMSWVKSRDAQAILRIVRDGDGLVDTASHFHDQQGSEDFLLGNGKTGGTSTIKVGWKK